MLASNSDVLALVFCIFELHSSWAHMQWFQCLLTLQCITYVLLGDPPPSSLILTPVSVTQARRTVSKTPKDCRKSVSLFAVSETGRHIAVSETHRLANCLKTDSLQESQRLPDSWESRDAQSTAVLETAQLLRVSETPNLHLTQGIWSVLH